MVEIQYEPTEAHDVTRDELHAIACRWVTFLQDEAYFTFACRQYCWRTELRKIHARRRLAWLDTVLGTDVIRRLWEASDLELRRQIGEEQWRVYTSGTQEERDQVVVDLDRRWKEDNRPRESASHAGDAAGSPPNHSGACSDSCGGEPSTEPGEAPATHG